jgi:hypothetical protein
MTIVDLSKIGFKDEPFVLAKDVHQVSMSRIWLANQRIKIPKKKDHKSQSVT